MARPKVEEKPCKYRNLPEGYERQTFIVKTSLINKFRALAWYFPGVTQKSLLETAMENYLSERVDPDDLKEAMEKYEAGQGKKLW